ncbi:MAG: VWA domain-containing protein [Victivallales bacterium]|nr:VWA domain-containing protein [Victivallales bacterium]
MSTYSFQPICPAWVIAMWSLVCLGLIMHSYRRQRDELPARIRGGLLALRLGALALLAALLLRPWRETATPQPDASRVVILADASASMFDHTDEIGDDGKPRCRWDAAAAVLPEHFPWTAERLRFADQGLLPWTAEATALPGETALGKALNEALESRRRPGALPLAAVVLLSDGCETAPDSSLIEAARHARALKIPVSTLAVGSSEVPPNAAVTFTTHRLSVPKGELITLTAQATSDFPKPFDATLTIRDNFGQHSFSRQIQLSPNASATFTFDLPAIDLAGDYAFTVRLSGQGEDGRPADDVDTLIVHIEEPPRRKLLYLAANPGWEWRFLRNVAEHASDLEISAILRIGRSDEDHATLPVDFRPNRLFHRFNLPGNTAEDIGFPTEPAEYADFDAVVLECGAAKLFTTEQQAALLAFVERRGGGLLLTGDPASLPAELLKLLPAKDFEQKLAPVQNTLLVNREFIFDGESITRLATGKIALPARTRYLVAHTPKPAARVALSDDHGNTLLVAQGNYGAGRVAWLGLEESWRWCLADQKTDDVAIHREFWETLLSWLGHNRQPTLRPELPAGELATGVPATLAAWVTGPDFLPAPAAQVQVRLQLPTQESRRLTLSPAPDELGLYQAEFTPNVAGAYTIEYTALTTPDAIAVTAQAMFLAQDFSREAQESAAQPELLADVARMTGGTALHPPVNWTRLPLSEQIPQHISRTHFLENIWILLTLNLLWGLEWWLRRRHGLK